MGEISVRVGSRAEAEWLWSRLVGAWIEEQPLRVVLDSVSAGRLVEAIALGLRINALRDAHVSLDTGART